MKHSEFLAALDQKAITDAIARAEKSCSGEIRVHVQPKAHGEIRHVAERTFERLGMTKTEQRNGVLLFIASEEHRFAIIGDRGIDEKVPAHFWDDTAAALTARFKAGEYTAGVVEAIERAGGLLSAHFPCAIDDRNELSNEISVDH